jgi:hypothetical protein
MAKPVPPTEVTPGKDAGVFTYRPPGLPVPSPPPHPSAPSSPDDARYEMPRRSAAVP